MPKKQPFGAYMKGHYDLYRLLLPAVLYVAIFMYVPMYGVLMAFQDYSPARGIMGSTFVAVSYTHLDVYKRQAYDYFSQSRLDRLNEYENLISLLSNTMMIQNDIAGITLYDAHKSKLAGVGKDFDVFAQVEMVSKLTYSNVFRPNSSSEAYFMVFYPVYDLQNGNYDKQLGICLLYTSRCV